MNIKIKLLRDVPVHACNGEEFVLKEGSVYDATGPFTGPSGNTYRLYTPHGEFYACEHSCTEIKE
ncbi:MAG: hypothetical protein FWF00_03055 [Endomicrobia bacterium]|nr:hypothetical protein [Endomicrobiia bacterium]